MVKPKVLVFSGYGLNSEEETRYAFELAGAEAECVHINDLIDAPPSRRKKLRDFQILAFPGGFAYGDDTGAGKAYANRIRDHLWEEFLKFLKEDKLIIGICNGFQILTSLGLLPAMDGNYGERQAALLPNKNARFINRWVDVKVENEQSSSSNKSPWVKGLDFFSAPIAHGEGRFFAGPETLTKLKKNGQIALRYVKGEVCKYQNLEPNPNGSLEEIAGITDETGKIFGLMPHPERGMFFTQLPHWTYIREKLKREGKEIPKFAQGIQIYKNGVNYYSK